MSEMEEVYEPFSIPEVYADGMGDAYVIGNVFKYVLFSYQRVPGMKGLHRVAVLKVARPVASIADAVRQAQITIGQTRLVRVDEKEVALHAH
jgi:hypothetical protein